MTIPQNAVSIEIDEFADYLKSRGGIDPQARAPMAGKPQPGEDGSVMGKFLADNHQKLPEMAIDKYFKPEPPAATGPQNNTMKLG